MKRIICGLLVFVWTTGLWAAVTNNVPSRADQEQLLMEAVLYQQQGFYGEAEKRLKSLIVLNPEQTAFKDMLTELQAKARTKQGDPAEALKQKLEQMVVPEVNFREAKPQEVVEWLQAESKKLNPEKTAINFVWLVPADAKLPGITLSLQKIPMSEVLRYATTLAKLQYRVEAHAVVISKPAEAPAEINAKP